MNVTFRQLRIFAEVARSGSIQRAAEAMHLTAPAVSMQIKEIESQIGLPMFDRTGRKLSLSTAGEYFLVYTRRLLATFKEADDAMARFKRLEAGRLTIGMVSTAKYFVPHLLARFREERPGVDVRLQVAGNREQLLVLLQSADIDLAVMGRPPNGIGVRSESFAAHPLVFLGPPAHPLHALGHPPVTALAPYPFIAREQGSGTRHAMEAFFREHQFEPHITMEMSSNETIKQAVMAGMGISFLSLHTVGLELRNSLISVIDIAGTPVMRTWNVVHQQARVLSPVAEAFRYYLLENGERYLRAHDAPLLPAALFEVTGPSASAATAASDMHRGENAERDAKAGHTVHPPLQPRTPR